jgi:hypothetical protein
VIYLAFSKCKCLLFPGMGLNFKQTQSCKCNFVTKNKMKFLSTFKHSFSQLCSIDHWTVVVVVVHHSKRKDCKIKIFYFFFIFIPCQLGTGENRSAVGAGRPDTARSLAAQFYRSSKFKHKSHLLPYFI